MTPDTEALWSVCVPVLANVPAVNGEEAEKRLTEALDRAGFNPWTDHGGEVRTAPFVAEDGTEPDVLP